MGAQKQGPSGQVHVHVHVTVRSYLCNGQGIKKIRKTCQKQATFESCFSEGPAGPVFPDNLLFRAVANRTLIPKQL